MTTTTLAFDLFIATAKSTRPDLAKRIDRAAEIVKRQIAGEQGDILYATIHAGDWVWKVKASDGGWYTVSETPDGLPACSCPDFEHRGKVCKHGLATRLMDRIRGGHVALPTVIERIAA